jgi:TusA-related sulfurtransferase
MAKILVTKAKMNERPSRRIDITADTCPITFVRTKLALERLADGDVIEVRLKGREPLENVPRSAREEGHEVLAIVDEGGGTHRVLIRKHRGA